MAGQLHFNIFEESFFLVERLIILWPGQIMYKMCFKNSNFYIWWWDYFHCISEGKPKSQAIFGEGFIKNKGGRSLLCLISASSSLQNCNQGAECDILLSLALPKPFKWHVSLSCSQIYLIIIQCNSTSTNWALALCKSNQLCSVFNAEEIHEKYRIYSLLIQSSWRDKINAGRIRLRSRIICNYVFKPATLILTAIGFQRMERLISLAWSEMDLWRTCSLIQILRWIYEGVVPWSKLCRMFVVSLGWSRKRGGRT